MTLFSDDQLSSYLDGETDDATAEVIEKAVNTDPGLATRLERLARHDRALRAAVDDALGPVPPRLVAMLEPSAVLSNVVPLGSRRPGLSPTLARALPLAAAVVFGVLVGVGYQGRQPQSLIVGTAAGPVAGAALAASLSTARGGEPGKMDGGTLRVALSFKARDGRLCRQFDARFEGADTEGVACRQPQGWRIEGWTVGGPSPADGAYRTAAGPDDPVVSAELTRLGVVDLLDRQGETAAIQTQWKAVPARP